MNNSVISLGQFLMILSDSQIIMKFLGQFLVICKPLWNYFGVIPGDSQTNWGLCTNTKHDVVTFTLSLSCKRWNVQQALPVAGFHSFAHCVTTLFLNSTNTRGKLENCMKLTGMCAIYSCLYCSTIQPFKTLQFGHSKPYSLAIQNLTVWPFKTLQF